ncbi:hypothetical protein EB796_003731 [Bugula neritina]|uniref:SLC5A9 n=1 Tax=Bugula neritina TaxID=10212 RepID=A0A7J7KHD1_BUGNE|nr:hypothetical protein EB796_003731 [Bugula neritina]
MELGNIVIGSIVSLVLFYLFVIFVGVASAIWFRRKFKVNGNNISFQIVAGRKLGSVVGWLTMSATMVGGGFLNGTAEMVALDGLVWTIPPFGICVGLTIGCLILC